MIDNNIEIEDAIVTFPRNISDLTHLRLPSIDLYGYTVDRIIRIHNKKDLIIVMNFYTLKNLFLDMNEFDNTEDSYIITIQNSENENGTKKYNILKTMHAVRIINQSMNEIEKSLDSIKKTKSTIIYEYQNY